MSVVICKYRCGFKFQCPISKDFYGPYFKSKECIQEFMEWYDQDIRLVGTWMNSHRNWNHLITEWLRSPQGRPFSKCFSKKVLASSLNQSTTDLSQQPQHLTTDDVPERMHSSYSSEHKSPEKLSLSIAIDSPKNSLPVICHSSAIRVS